MNRIWVDVTFSAYGSVTFSADDLREMFDDCPDTDDLDAWNDWVDQNLGDLAAEAYEVGSVDMVEADDVRVRKSRGSGA